MRMQQVNACTVKSYRGSTRWGSTCAYENVHSCFLNYASVHASSRDILRGNLSCNRGPKPGERMRGKVPLCVRAFGIGRWRNANARTVRIAVRFETFVVNVLPSTEKTRVLTSIKYFTAFLYMLFRRSFVRVLAVKFRPAQRMIYRICEIPTIPCSP